VVDGPLQQENVCVWGRGESQYFVVARQQKERGGWGSRPPRAHTQGPASSNQAPPLKGFTSNNITTGSWVFQMIQRGYQARAPITDSHHLPSQASVLQRLLALLSDPNPRLPVGPGFVFLLLPIFIDVCVERERFSFWRHWG
jgi:hypothetical protein